MEITDRQKKLLETISEELDGKLSYWICSTKSTEHNKIIIEYANNRKSKDLS